VHIPVAPGVGVPVAGVGVTGTRFLITKGIIQIRRQAVKGHYDLRISKSAIDLFTFTYVLPAKLALQFNTTSARLTNLLITGGVNPLSGPKVDGGKQYVFRRTDIEGIDLEAIWRDSAGEHISRLNEGKLIDAQRAAKILNIDQSSVLDLARRGILKQHRHASSSRYKANGPFFSTFTLEKYKDRKIDYSGLVSSTVAAEMLSVSVAILYRYIPKKLLQVALDVGEGRRCFRLDDVKRLIEDRNRLKQQYVTTAEVATLCKVKKESVHAWVGAGLLQPISGPRADGLVHNLYLLSDIENLYAEREAYKAKQLSEGRSSRFGRPAGLNRQPVRNKVYPRIEQLVKNGMLSRMDSQYPARGYAVS
jgi:DNA-binding transcriptional MerR regulator